MRSLIVFFCLFLCHSASSAESLQREPLKVFSIFCESADKKPFSIDGKIFLYSVFSEVMYETEADLSIYSEESSYSLSIAGDFFWSKVFGRHELNLTRYGSERDGRIQDLKFSIYPDNPRNGSSLIYTGKHVTMHILHCQVEGL